MMAIGGRSVFSISIAAALLAGCGASQPIGMPGAMPRSAAIARAEHRGAWMLANAKDEDLLYVATGDNVYALTLDGKVAGALGVASYALCADRKGDIFVTQTALSEVYKYAHGAVTPLQTLADGDQPLGCAVDPKTGNLAVTNEGSGAGEVAIFPKALAPATYYRDNEVSQYGLCGYDDTGNLFVTGIGSGSLLAELPRGSTSFANFTLGPRFDPFDSVQWDGSNVTLANASTREIYRLKISNKVRIISAVRMREWYAAHSGGWPYVQTWLQRNQFYGQVSVGADIGSWIYPRGGKPHKVIGPFRSGNTGVYGLAVSVSSN